MNPQITGFFDEATHTISYVVVDRETGHCAVIDSVLDFDQAAGRTYTNSADRLIQMVQEGGYTCEWIIDTHVHADHLTAAPYIQAQIGGRTAIGSKISMVQEYFREIFNEGDTFRVDGSQFDHLFTDGETYQIGKLSGRAIHTPGHTPACMSHHIGNAVFVGDTLFMPDYGTARCDFPGGSAETLYDSIQRLFTLPGDTRLFLCHDYKAPGRDTFAWETTVAEEKRNNVHVGEGVTREEFVAMRSARDATLSMPKLILPSVQINMRAGQMPAPESNGKCYMKLPINAF